MDRDLVEQFAVCNRQFADWFNVMTELTIRLPDQEQAKRVRRVMAECLGDLDLELYRELRRSHPDLFGVPDLHELRRIGWNYWDPIGLAQQNSPREEYDRYLIHAADMLTGQSVAAVTAYLRDMVANQMGLAPDEEACTQTARALADYIASLRR